MRARLRSLFAGGGLASRARRSSVFVVLKFGASNVMRLISNLILTRLLFPEAFGLMALLQVVMAGLKMFSDVGLKASIVQHERGEDPDFLRTAWTLQVIRGLLLAAIVALSAPYVAEFYEEPLLAQLLPVAGLGLVIDGFRPARALVASRNLTIGRLMLTGLAGQLVTILLSVFLAWQLQSVWALVWGNLIGGLFRNFLIYRIMPGIPDRFRLEGAAVRNLIGFGAFVFLSSAASFLIENGDRAMLGKFITLELLGIYAIALSMAAIPYQVMKALSQRVIFPLYSRRPPHENAEARRKLFRARFMLTSVVFSIGALLVIVGDPLIRFLYDPRYEAAGGITVMLAMGFLPMLTVASYNPILLSNGRSDLHMVYEVSRGLLRLAALYVGIVNLGVAGAALAPAIAAILHYPIMIALTHRYKAWDPRHDLVFMGLAVLIAWLGWTLHEDAIRAVFAL